MPPGLYTMFDPSIEPTNWKAVQTMPPAADNRKV